jgi:hypothetical protein
MFAQCFYQYGIEGVLDESDYKHLSHEQKLWVSNVVLGTEDCHDPFILEVVYFVKEKLNNYLLNNAEDLMKKAATKVEENFLGTK